YNAVVIAVARNGQRLPGKIGSIELQAGDTLLLEAHPSFADVQRNSRDFYLVSRVENSTPPRHERAWIALVTLFGMVLAAFWIEMLLASFVAAAAMIALRCVHGVEARRSIDWSVLVTIAAGIGLGAAVEESGTAHYIAHNLIRFAGDNETLALAIIYGLTMVLTNLITAKAAAGVIFYLAIQTAHSLGADPMPFAIAVIIASAASFATPMGYQTNMMVFGPGGYRYLDYVRFGGPLSLLLWAVSITIIPLVWPFHPVL
ncbi:MAG: anion permease, partial [Planctomycetaceae bacterium]|nr:anion permease [Planctomycetaceae bacterium]